MEVITLLGKSCVTASRPRTSLPVHQIGLITRSQGIILWRSLYRRRSINNNRQSVSRVEVRVIQDREVPHVRSGAQVRDLHRVRSTSNLNETRVNWQSFRVQPGWVLESGDGDSRHVGNEDQGGGDDLYISSAAGLGKRIDLALKRALSGHGNEQSAIR